MSRLASISLAVTVLGFAAPALADRQLSAADVRKVMAEHGDEVKACYLQHGMKQRSASGKVTVSAVVDRDGRTARIAVVAPGVKGKHLARCVDRSAKDWQFPATSGVTEVELPFLFQHTHARGAGPVRSSRRSP